MSLQVDGFWKGRFWAPEFWAKNFWFEGAETDSGSGGPDKSRAVRYGRDQDISDELLDALNTDVADILARTQARQVVVEVGNKRIEIAAAPTIALPEAPVTPRVGGFTKQDRINAALIAVAVLEALDD